MQTNKTIVISCAGIGSRLGLAKTKALIDINGHPLIWWQLKNMSDVEDVRVVVGFQANEVIKTVNEIRKDIIFVYNHDYFNNKTGASFFLGAKFSRKFVVEWDGDLLLHPDDAKKILKMNEEYIAFSSKASEEGVFVKLNSENNKVVAFDKKNGKYEWTGPAMIEREKVFFTKENVYNQLEKSLPIKGVKVRARDIDTYTDYVNAIKFIQTWGNYGQR